MSASILEALSRKRVIEEQLLFQEAERLSLVGQGRGAEAEAIHHDMDAAKVAINLIGSERFLFKEIEPIIELLEAMGSQAPLLVASAIANEKRFASLQPMIERLLPFVIFPEPKDE